jgi:protein-S-isoprenylcysteine O-methyltransferase Ste14
MSYGLVFAQFGLLLVLLWQVQQAWPAVTFGTIGAALLAASVALGLWALVTNRPGNFNVVPEPHENGQLVTFGPYRWVRHPMYTSLLMFAAACAVVIDGWWAWYTWAMLLVVLWFKSAYEEHLLMQRFAQYKAYQDQTKRFLPWLW